MQHIVMISIIDIALDVSGIVKLLRNITLLSHLPGHYNPLAVITNTITVHADTSVLTKYVVIRRLSI